MYSKDTTLLGKLEKSNTSISLKLENHFLNSKASATYLGVSISQRNTPQISDHRLS